MAKELSAAFEVKVPRSDLYAILANEPEADIRVIEVFKTHTNSAGVAIEVLSENPPASISFMTTSGWQKIQQKYQFHELDAERTRVMITTSLGAWSQFTQGDAMMITTLIQAVQNLVAIEYGYLAGKNG